LTVSLSSHDYLGHQLGPNHADMEEITVDEDRMISDFLNRLSKKIPGGMDGVFVVLTGDHGIPPVPLPKERVPSENLPEAEIGNGVEAVLTRQFGRPSGGKWVDAVVEAQVYLNSGAMKSAGITPAQAVIPVREALLRERYADQVWARDEILHERKVPAGEYGIVADRTLNRRSGELIVVLKPYYFSDPHYPVTHMTLYSYDRYVPLVFYGKTFKPGVYRQIVNVVDIAPTLSGVLGVLPPSQSEGRVLTETLR
jgi:predicted AlkP superfamily pyrophosphatase or phosphodiesterase